MVKMTNILWRICIDALPGHLVRAGTAAQEGIFYDLSVFRLIIYLRREKQKKLHLDRREKSHYNRMADGV